MTSAESTSKEFVRARSGRRFMKVSDDFYSLLQPRPPPKETSFPANLKPPSRKPKAPSSDSKVPLLISRSSRHRLGCRQPLPAIKKAPLTYRDSYPLRDPPDEKFVDIAVRLPDGERIERRFSLGDPLGCVMAFVERHKNGAFELPCELVPSAGRVDGGKSLRHRQMGMSLEELGINRRTLLHLQEIDD
eukprot:m.311619 g.311619  ORF g.311619 m.311619 type:complete len:189 (+) comp88927_c0_seq1:93-659(+)